MDRITGASLDACPEKGGLASLTLRLPSCAVRIFTAWPSYCTLSGFSMRQAASAMILLCDLKSLQYFVGCTSLRHAVEHPNCQQRDVGSSGGRGRYALCV